MSALHSRVVPGSEHTLDDLVFAAFQGPVLGLTSRVLHQHRSFAALLLVRARWRSDRRLSQADVEAALAGARCCRPDTLAPAECARCGGVLDVAENAAEQRRLRRDLPHDIELYTVTLRTRCTSSRKHVGCSMLLLAVDLAPGIVVVSDRFAIYARHAGRHVHSAGWSSGDDSGGSSGSATPRVPLLPAAPEFAEASESSCWLVGPELTLPGPGALQLQQAQAPPMVIAVSLSVVSISEEEQRQVTWGLVPLLRSNVPGFLMQKSSTHESFMVYVVGFCSLGSLLLASQFGRMFIRNEIRNPLNRNLIAEGLLHTVLRATNVQWPKKL
eukprot:m51a1_g1473 hypothetical protein (328) ;mRNA; r:254283-255442